MSSKKTVLKETPNVPATSHQKVKKKNDYLRECINTILKRELLHLNIKKVFDILVNDLHINLKNVSPRMKYVLCECLCYYIKMWPGWQKYDVVCTNERAKVEYIEKFKEYLIFKINYILENERVFNPDILKMERPVMVSHEVQTEPINKKNKPEAPYNLVISGQPNVLNNIVFIEVDGDIVIKQHAEKPWKPLTVAEFLNYSFVNVGIRLPDLELSRSNLHEFRRYITECGDCATCPDIDFITFIRKRNQQCKPKVYSMDYIHAYCKQFLETIKKIQLVNPVKITELEEVFRQFILDIKESNVFSYTNEAGKTANTMATDTWVCFNIGGKTYIRNKKMVVNTESNQKESNAINFCEVLIPRMAYTLSKFTAEEDITTEDTTFKSLNEINKEISIGTEAVHKFVETVNNSVTYHCLLCPKVYVGERAYIDILDHFRFLHKGEQSVLCFKCRRQFTIARLAGTRWAHDCVENGLQDTHIGSTNNGSSGSAVECVEGLANSQYAPSAKGSIGINDLLSSGKSTISFDDLVSRSEAADTAPVSGKSNASSNTAPMVSVRIPTGQAVPQTPTSGVLLTIAPSIPSNSVTIPSNPIVVASSSFNLGSNPIAVPPGIIIGPPDAAITTNTSTTLPMMTDDLDFDLSDNKADIQSEIDMQLASAIDDVNGMPILQPQINMGNTNVLTNILTGSAANVTSDVTFTTLPALVTTTPVNAVPLPCPPLVFTTVAASTVVNPVNAAGVDTIPIISTLPVTTTTVVTDNIPI